MSFTPERRHEGELMDEPEASPAEIAGSLRDLRRVNRFLGGYRPILQTLAELAHSVPKEETLRVLDVATGSADTPVRIVEWARRNHRKVEITAMDINPEILVIAEEYTVDYPEIRLVQADAMKLPFPNGAFHVAVCSLTLHHFESPEAVVILKEMRRVSRVGIILNDLERGWIPWLWITLLTRLLTRNRLTRHDGPLSVLRAYTPDELSEIAKQALDHFTIDKEPFYRQMLVSSW